ncbi:hypothetical protein [Falsiroseomonas sp.]|uniref:hypothetical protein n=1 Tax=Falsiroseomonas sp. TaxID=2870721 RepID=UPI002735E300|nr:hypothetical protein [Falsiroseomonas sp.]MDP3417889.1 hypothetical protein [Falsiroseomonas sp.]
MSAAFPIERGAPPPAETRGRPRSEVSATLRAMEPGDAVTFPAEIERKLVHSAVHYINKASASRKFTARKVAGGNRVWCLAVQQDAGP